MLKTNKSASAILLGIVATFLFLNPTQLKADAVCQDGWYSHSSGSGTCSHHGGVSYWVTGEVTNYPVLTFAPLLPQIYPQIAPTPPYIEPPVIETRPIYTSPSTAPSLPRLKIPSPPKSTSECSFWTAHNDFRDSWRNLLV